MDWAWERDILLSWGGRQMGPNRGQRSRKIAFRLLFPKLAVCTLCIFPSCSFSRYYLGLTLSRGVGFRVIKWQVIGTSLLDGIYVITKRAKNAFSGVKASFAVILWFFCVWGIV